MLKILQHIYIYGIIIVSKNLPQRMFMELHEIQALRDAILSLNDQVDRMQNMLSKRSSSQYSSEDLNELFSALSKAQGEYATVGYNRENPYFKSAYADLDAIMKSVRPALAKHGLAFMQQIRINEDGATILHSILAHASGQWMESRMRVIPPKNDAQTFGSTLTYLKRYAAISLLGVTVSHDHSDDDAEVAMVESRDIYAKGIAINTKYNPKEQTPEVITKEQLDELEYELAQYPDIAELVLDGLKIQSLADMPKSKYQVSVNRIREIKNLRNGIK